MDNPNLLPEEQQPQFLPELSKFIQNPWFGHFCAAFKLQEEASNAVIFSRITPDLLYIREQTIGEARAYGAFETTIRETHADLVRKVTEAQTKPRE